MAATTAPTFTTPTKHTPNPHPYAIKTTSTALLSRSSSTSSKPAARHYYVPLSPASRAVNSSSSSVDESDGIKRRHTMSDASEDAAAAAVRALATTTDKEADTTPRTGGRRRVRAPIDNAGELAANPRLWTPAELAARLPAELGAWVRETGINGRAFLRLTEDGLDSRAPVEHRAALLAAAHALRHGSMRDRVLPDSGASVRFPSPTRSQSSVSSISTGGSSRVRDLVASLERRSPSPTRDEHNHRKSTSGGSGGIITHGLFEELPPFGSEPESPYDGLPSSHVAGPMAPPPLPAPPMYQPRATRRPVNPFAQAATASTDEDISIHDLLASSFPDADGAGLEPAHGALAWELSDALPGVTARRVSGGRPSAADLFASPPPPDSTVAPTAQALAADEDDEQVCYPSPTQALAALSAEEESEDDDDDDDDIHARLRALEGRVNHLEASLAEMAAERSRLADELTLQAAARTALEEQQAASAAAAVQHRRELAEERAELAAAYGALKSERAAQDAHLAATRKLMDEQSLRAEDERVRVDGALAAIVREGEVARVQREDAAGKTARPAEAVGYGLPSLGELPSYVVMMSLCVAVVASQVVITRVVRKLR